MTNTRMIDEISNAIYAHSAWKLQLRSAITKASSGMTPELAACDNQCEFGRWLYGPTIPPDRRQSMPYQVVQRLHAEFHQAAGSVLARALDRRSGEATALLSSDFYDRSQVLIAALTKWKQELAEQKVA